MKKIMFFATTLLLSLNVNAAEYGFGATLNGESSTIYIPINITKEFRVEPYFSSFKQKPNEYSGPYRANQYGLGLFKVKEAPYNTNIIMGVRAAYTSGDSSGKFDGYSFGPVLGFEYYPIENFSVGADVSWQYTQMKYSGAPQYYGDDGYTTKYYRTTTSVFIKYYFK